MFTYSQRILMYIILGTASLGMAAYMVYLAICDSAHDYANILWAILNLTLAVFSYYMACALHTRQHREEETYLIEGMV